MKRLTATTAFAVVLLAATGCGLLETRPPQEPIEQSSSYVPPTEPALVLTNMENSFKEANTLNYARSFSDSASGGEAYTFEPSPQALLKYPGMFDQWTKRSEEQYFDNLKSKIVRGFSMSLTFARVSVQSVVSDSAQYEVEYVLTAPHSVPGVPSKATGKALFTLAADGSRNWAIKRWIEVPTTVDTFTWSDVKGLFGQ